MIHSYPWYSKDWRGSETRLSLTLEERSIYRDLLDHCWEEGSLPNNERMLAGIAGATPLEFKRCWPAMAHKFIEKDGRLFNDRVDERRPALIRWHEQRSNAGKASAERKRQRKENDRSTTVEVSLQPSAYASSTVPKNNTTPPRRSAPSAAPEPPFDGPDPEQLVAAAVEACAEVWPNIGDKRHAKSSWEREAASSTRGISGWCTAIVETARVHAGAHREARSNSKKHFIPTLDRWVSSGDYTSPPPDVIRQHYGPRDLGPGANGNG